MSKILATTVTLAALAAPASASAMLPNDLQPAARPTKVAAVAPQPPTSAVRSLSPGFQWADAGIGAGGAILLLGASVGLGRRRQLRHTVA